MGVPMGSGKSFELQSISSPFSKGVGSYSSTGPTEGSATPSPDITVSGSGLLSQPSRASSSTMSVTAPPPAATTQRRLDDDRKPVADRFCRDFIISLIRSLWTARAKDCVSVAERYNPLHQRVAKSQRLLILGEDEAGGVTGEGREMAAMEIEQSTTDRRNGIG